MQPAWPTSVSAKPPKRPKKKRAQDGLSHAGHAAMTLFDSAEELQWARLQRWLRGAFPGAFDAPRDPKSIKRKPKGKGGGQFGEGGGGTATSAATKPQAASAMPVVAQPPKHPIEEKAGKLMNAGMPVEEAYAAAQKYHVREKKAKAKAGVPSAKPKLGAMQGPKQPKAGKPKAAPVTPEQVAAYEAEKKVAKKTALAEKKASQLAEAKAALKAGGFSDEYIASATKQFEPKASKPVSAKPAAPKKPKAEKVPKTKTTPKPRASTKALKENLELARRFGEPSKSGNHLEDVRNRVAATESKVLDKDKSSDVGTAIADFFAMIH